MSWASTPLRQPMGQGGLGRSAAPCDSRGVAGIDVGMAPAPPQWQPGSSEQKLANSASVNLEIQPEL